MVAADGKPEVSGSSRNPARTLGVRTEGRRRDVDVDDNGWVFPQTKGMSVSPPPPSNLAEHRRPEEYGGTGDDPVWELDTDDLQALLAYRPDPDKPKKHGLIGVSDAMSLEVYISLLHATRDLWHPYQPS